MATRRTPLPDWRTFSRVASQRFEDAECLLGNFRTTGAVYLAGYGVECMLKALWLHSAPAGRQTRITASFRGERGHDIDWLFGAAGLRGTTPKSLRETIVYLRTWTTSFRYRPGMIEFKEAEEFVERARAFIQWAQGRL